MDAFADSFDLLVRNLPRLAEGLAFSLTLTVASALAGLVLGIPLALMRLSANRALSSFALAYVTFFRCVPLLLVIFWFFFLMPLVLQHATGARFPVPIGPVYSAFITFAIFEAAYYCEIVRAGIQSVPRGQLEAARALRLSPFDVYRHVILPQALPRMLPVLLLQTVVLFQDTSLVYVLTLPDFVGMAARLGQREGQLGFFYGVVAVVFFVCCFALSRAVRHLERRYGVAT
ncbi:amino acid ABC transporter permease [Ramlibacter sp.]|uniref:amino acid ABC transporter permease n=1 Tax=Ramlibacter sp. TaxID=1917967 RepID=UPI003D09C0B9